MTKPLNVDICFTLLSDKPPALPLREELQSLGIEVVYNAHGVGAHASKHASKKLVKEFREQELVKQMKHQRFYPSNPKKVDDRKRREQDLMVPRALSYENYEKELLHTNKNNGSTTDSNSSVSSSDTRSTASGGKSNSQSNHKKSKGWGKFRLGSKMKQDDKPPTMVEIPSSTEDQAVKDAANAFSGSQHDLLGKSESRSGSGTKTPSSGGGGGTSTTSGRDMSTLSSLPMDAAANKVEVFVDPPSTIPGSKSGSTTTAMRSDPPSVRLESSSSTRGSSTISTTKDALSPLRPQQQQQHQQQHQQQQIVVQSPPPSPALEFYDLTAISDEEDVKGVAFDSSSMMSHGNSTLSSSQKEPKYSYNTNDVQVFSSPETRGHLPGLQMTTFPEVEDGYGHVVTDLSWVDEDSLSRHGNHSYASLVGSHRLSPRRLERVDEQDDGINQAPTEPTRNLAHPAQDWTTYEGVSYGDDEEDYLTNPASPHYSNGGETASDFDETEDGGLPLRQALSQGSDNFADGSILTAASPNKIPQGSPKGATVAATTTPPGDIDVTTSSSRRSTFLNNYGDVVDAFKYDNRSPGLQTVMLNASYLAPYGVVHSVLSDERSYPEMSLSGHSRPTAEDYPPRVSRVSFSQDVEEHYYVKDESSSLDDRGSGNRVRPNVAIPEEEDEIEKFYEDSSPTKQQEKQNSSPHQITSYEDCFNLPSVEKPQDTDAMIWEKSYKSREKQDKDDSRDYSSSSDSDSSGYSGSFREGAYDNDGGDDSDSEVQVDRVASMRAGFIAALSAGIPISSDVEEIMQSTPELARTKLSERERLPLHVVCDRNFPDRSLSTQGDITYGLVRDIMEHKRLIEAIAGANMEACTVPDENGDLPVHILARRLMEWEAQWYQKVYENAQNESPDDGGKAASITKLYQTMSQSIDLVLHPTAASRTLCQIPGSVGYLLPLHIAAIFTVSYTTLKSLLEMYPEAATSRCDLIDVRTFIPSNALPLELHDRLSTDFPKWEIEAGSATAESSWTQMVMEKSYGAKDCIRRSDLIFAYNPYVAPYRSDENRLQRIEARIRLEASKVANDDMQELSPAVRLLWIWMCTFDCPNDDKDDGDRAVKYFDSIIRIVQPLPMRTVRMLSLVPANDDERPIMDVATAECTYAIRQRLDEIASLDIPIPVADMSTGSNSSDVLRRWEEGLANKLSLQGRGYVSVLCRSLFHLNEDKFPTSFVFLPYRLIKDKRGRLGLESAAAAEIALKFSDCLLQLTCPKKIRHYLEKKSIRFLGQSLGNGNDDSWFEEEDEIKDQVDELLKLYEKGSAYFYFLDEHTGIPVVSGRNSLYPLKILDPVEMVRKVLPLMLTGMILMRGEKALSVIASILLDKKISLVQQHWIDTAKDLVGFLVSPRTEWTDVYLQDLMHKKDELVDLIEKGPSIKAPANDARGISSEWAVELSAVRMLVEMHDPKRIFANLTAKSGGNKVIWTRDKSFLDKTRENLFTYDFKSIADLRETFSENADSSHNSQEIDESQTTMHSDDADASSPKEESEVADGYAHLFGDLAMPCEQHSWSNNEKQEEQQDPMPWSPIDVTLPMTARKSRYASETQPISLLTFELDCELDDVLQLRIQLDEQESKLEFLKDKLTDILSAEQTLVEEEDEMGRQLDEVLGYKVAEDEAPNGLARARKLLLRISALEDRVLVREIEAQQLNMDVSCFGLEAKEGREKKVIVIEERFPEEVSVSKKKVPIEISFSGSSVQ
jgi:hypothetical protein